MTQRAIVIGGGLAGCGAAYALSKRGWSVDLLEKNSQLASEASGNIAGIVYPHLTTNWIDSTYLYFQGLDYTMQLVDDLRGQGHKIKGEWCGMLQLPREAKDAARLLATPTSLGLDANIVRQVNVAQASELSGLEIQQAGVHIAKGGWLCPPDFCAALASGSNILLNAEVDNLQKIADIWQVHLKNGEVLSAPVVIIANAAAATRFIPQLKLYSVAGQVSLLRAEHSPQLAPLKLVLCHNGYAIPTHDNINCIGATYEREDTGFLSAGQAHRLNLKHLQKFIPTLLDSALEGVTGRLGWRCTRPGNIPLLGQVPEPAGQGYYQKGLYISVAHASRGMLSCPLGGEWIARQIVGEPVDELYDAFSLGKYLRWGRVM